MSWLDRLLGRKAVSDTGALARMLSPIASKSGARVNWQTALRVSTVLGCARVIAEGIAQTPIKLVRSQSGVREIQYDNPLHQLFSDSPNEWMTPFEMLELMAVHLVLTGNAFVFLVRDQFGKVLELLPLQPNWVTVKQLADWSLEYRVRFNGSGEQVIPAQNIWHVRGPGWVGYLGFDMVAHAREAIGLALATEEFGASLFANGGRPGGVLTSEQTLDEAKLKALREQWRDTHEGSSNAMRTAILSGGLKYHSLSMTSDEAQFMETRRYTVEDTCRYFRVLPIMVGHSGDKNATYASAEQMFIHHDSHTLAPWWTRIEQSARKNLLTPADRANGLTFKFMPNALMRGSAQTRADYYSKALGAGGSPAWMTQDEVRAFEDMNPMGGPAALLPVATNVPGTPQE